MSRASQIRKQILAQSLDALSEILPKIQSQTVTSDNFIVFLKSIQTYKEQIIEFVKLDIKQQNHMQEGQHSESTTPPIEYAVELSETIKRKIQKTLNDSGQMEIYISNCVNQDIDQKQLKDIVFRFDRYWLGCQLSVFDQIFDAINNFIIFNMEKYNGLLGTIKWIFSNLNQILLEGYDYAQLIDKLGPKVTNLSNSHPYFYKKNIFEACIQAIKYKSLFTKKGQQNSKEQLKNIILLKLLDLIVIKQDRDQTLRFVEQHIQGKKIISKMLFSWQKSGYFKKDSIGHHIDDIVKYMVNLRPMPKRYSINYTCKNWRKYDLLNYARETYRKKNKQALERLSNYMKIEYKLFKKDSEQKVLIEKVHSLGELAYKQAYQEQNIDKLMHMTVIAKFMQKALYIVQKKYPIDKTFIELLTTCEASIQLNTKVNSFLYQLKYGALIDEIVQFITWSVIKKKPISQYDINIYSFHKKHIDTVNDLTNQALSHYYQNDTDRTIWIRFVEINTFINQIAKQSAAKLPINRKWCALKNLLLIIKSRLTDRKVSLNERYDHLITLKLIVSLAEMVRYSNDEYIYEYLYENIYQNNENNIAVYAEFTLKIKRSIGYHIDDLARYSITKTYSVNIENLENLTLYQAYKYKNDSTIPNDGEYDLCHQIQLRGYEKRIKDTPNSV